MTTVFDELCREAMEAMESIKEERKGFPRHRAKVEEFLAKMPDDKRKMLRDLLLP